MRLQRACEIIIRYYCFRFILNTLRSHAAILAFVLLSRLSGMNGDHAACPPAHTIDTSEYMHLECVDAKQIPYLSRWWPSNNTYKSVAFHLLWSERTSERKKVSWINTSSHIAAHYLRKSCFIKIIYYFDAGPSIIADTNALLFSYFTVYNNNLFIIIHCFVCSF